MDTYHICLPAGSAGENLLGLLAALEESRMIEIQDAVIVRVLGGADHVRPLVQVLAEETGGLHIDDEPLQPITRLAGGRDYDLDTTARLQDQKNGRKPNGDLVIEVETTEGHAAAMTVDIGEDLPICAASDCSNRFKPARSDSKYCSRACYQRDYYRKQQEAASETPKKALEPGG